MELEKALEELRAERKKNKEQQRKFDEQEKVLSSNREILEAQKVQQDQFKQLQEVIMSSQSQTSRKSL